MVSYPDIWLKFSTSLQWMNCVVALRYLQHHEAKSPWIRNADCGMRMWQEMDRMVVLPNVWMWMWMQLQMQQSGSLNGPIGVNASMNAAPFAIEQPVTLTFLHRFVARKTENHIGIHAACSLHINIHILHTYGILHLSFTQFTTTNSVAYIRWAHHHVYKLSLCTTLNYSKEM